MLGIRITVPIACFRKGLAREYLETEPLPPPSSCYGLLLSLVGETQRVRHIGCRVAPVLMNCPERSVVLRTVWRVKKTPLGTPGNTRPDYQQLLSPVELVVWLDSMHERNPRPTLEDRARTALVNPAAIDRFGGLSLGESTHLVDEIHPLEKYLRSASFQRRQPEPRGQAFLLASKGRLTLPVWVDHVGSAGTRYVTGDLHGDWPIHREPAPETIPVIEPPQGGRPNAAHD
jgi:CRISPR-associated protein Cas5t